MYASNIVLVDDIRLEQTRTSIPAPKEQEAENMADTSFKTVWNKSIEAAQWLHSLLSYGRQALYFFRASATNCLRSSPLRSVAKMFPFLSIMMVWGMACTPFAFATSLSQPLSSES